MADIIKTTIDKLTLAELKAESAKPVRTLPTLTAAVITRAKDLLKTGAIKGYTDIAKEIGFDKIRKPQVKRIHRRMKVRIAELTPNDITI